MERFGALSGRLGTGLRVDLHPDGSAHVSFSDPEICVRTRPEDRVMPGSPIVFGKNLDAAYRGFCAGIRGRYVSWPAGHNLDDGTESIRVPADIGTAS